MNHSIKSLTIILALSVCVCGAVWSTSHHVASAMDGNTFDTGHFDAISNAPVKLSLNQIESIIRHDPMTKELRGDIDFGSVTVERGAVVAEVVVRDAPEPVQQFVCTLRYKAGSWYVAKVWPSIQPRNHHLRV